MEVCVESHTELDSHANMPVVGKHAYIIAETGKKVDVSPFTPDYKPLTIPLVDATVKYDNPNNGKTYILGLCNALYVPSMDHNLIPPFMLREMGVTVNDVPKIHKENPTVDDHAITFAETGFRIPLSLWGIFSYFPTSKPTHDDLLNPNEVYILSPATWNPDSDAYSANEESMLDWEGNMQPKKDHQHRIVLDDVEDNVTMVASLSITPLEQEAIDMHLIEDDERSITRSGDCVSNTLGSISNTLVDLVAVTCVTRSVTAGLLQGSVRPAPYSRDISPTVKLKPMNKVMMIPLAMLMTNALTYSLIWMVMEPMNGWMSSFLIQHTPQDHEVSLLSTYLRYGAYPTRTLKGRLTRQLKRLYAHKILRCHAIMVQMTVCFVTSASRTISLWIPSLLLRKVDAPLEVIHVANSLSLTRVSSMWYQCAGNQKFSKPSNSSPRRLVCLHQSLQICLANKCHTMCGNSAMTLEQPFAH